MAALSIQTVSPAGAAISWSSAAGGGDTINPSRDTLLAVKNDDASPTTVTITVPGTTSYGGANPDVALAVAAGAVALFRVLPTFADTDGLVDVSYSSVTSLSVAAIEIVDS